MAKGRDLSKYDASAHAAAELEYVIQTKRPDDVPVQKRVPVAEALQQQRVQDTRSDRDVTRVLFISQDTELLNPAQQSLDGYLDISTLFAEVHILILREGIAPKDTVLRPTPNVWLYTAAAPTWWQIPQAGVKLASEQLQFASGFRPDLIVARDPFESAIVAEQLGKKFDRPTQLHIMEDYQAPAFRKRQAHFFWRRFIPRFTIPRFTSVRTSTTQLHSRVCHKYAPLDCSVLPQFHNYLHILERTDALDLAQQYHPIAFFMLYIGELTHDSSLFTVMQATQEVLQNRRVGLLVLGDGPERKAFEQQAKTLGIEKQVIFKPAVQDIVPYLLGAHMLFVTDTDAPNETVAKQGAAAGVPMIMARTEKRSDIFTHQSSAYFCDTINPHTIKRGVDLLLEHVSIRNHFAAAGKRIIKEKFHGDPAEYKNAYRSSIEEAFFVEELVKAKTLEN